MSDDALNRFDRIVAMFIHLQSSRVVKAQELADRFDVSLRTVYRDIPVSYPHLDVYKRQPLSIEPSICPDDLNPFNLSRDPSANAIVNEKIVPTPTSLSMFMAPPINSTNLSLIHI